MRGWGGGRGRGLGGGGRGGGGNIRGSGRGGVGMGRGRGTNLAGRPSKLELLSTDVKMRLAMTSVKYGVSYGNTLPIATMWLSSSSSYVKSEVTKKRSKIDDGDPLYKRLKEVTNISSNLIVPATAEIYARVFKHESGKLYTSKQITLLIDGSSDGHQRNPLAIRIIGVYENGEIWDYPVRFCEPPDHKALTQLNEIKSTFDEINKLHPEIAHRLSVLDLFMVVFDTTSSNTGLDKGLAGK